MFVGRLQYLLIRAWRSIWFRPAAFAVLAVVALALAPVFQPLVPTDWVYTVKAEVVDRVLSILTSSMLAVAIFALSTMVMQLNAAAQAATPRTRQLLSQDRTAQNAISTFLGAFLFAVLGVIAIELNLYEPTGLFVLFVLSLVLIVLVVLNMILWIRRLSTIGGVGEAMERVETAADQAFAELAVDPCLGGCPVEALPEDGYAVCARRTGFVQTLDEETLGRIADRLDGPLYVAVRPGDFVDVIRPLALLSAAPDGETEDELREAFVIGHDRDFRSDPRFGVVVLSEMASRALSPAVNDPGTAIDVIGTLVRVLTDWRSRAAEAAPEPRHPGLRVVPLDPGHVLEAAYRAIGRDGAGMVEVGDRLQQALATLAGIDRPAFAEAARRLSAEHLARAREAIDFEDDIQALEAAAARHWRAPLTRG